MNQGRTASVVCLFMFFTMHKKKLTGANWAGMALVLSMFASCNDELIQVPSVTEDQVIVKEGIINPADKVLMVRIDCGNTEGVQIMADETGAMYARPVFDMSTGDVQLKKSLGLDKWYEFGFEEECELDDKAAVLATMASVSRVEYNAVIEKHYVGKSYPYVPGPETRAIDKTRFNDPYNVDQWAYENTGNKGWAPTAKEGADLNIAQAWTLCAGNPDVIVAVIDEAVQWDHPDLAANMWCNADEREGNGTDDDKNGYVDDIHGYNFVDWTGTLDWRSDGNVGHGTHVAGSVAAVNNNGTGVSGVAGGSGNNDGVKIMSCQIFNRDGSASLTGLAKAFEYAADNGACIAQCSFGIPGGAITSDAAYIKNGYKIEVDAIRYFIGKSNCQALEGGLVIASSGNDGTAMSGYPAALQECISVCSVGVDGLPAYYTNYHHGCNISTPGGEYFTGGTYSEKATILSTMPTQPIRLLDNDGNLTGEVTPTNYGYMQGTSMACPHMSGVAALGLSYALKTGKRYTNDEYKAILLSSVTGFDEYLYGTKQTLVGSAIGSMQLSPYKGKMGTGCADVWRLYMQMDGVPALVAEIGKAKRIDISDYFGSGAENLIYTGVEISQTDKSAIGLAEDPEIAFGKLKVHPTKTGCARLTVKALAGSSVGSSNNPGAMEISKTISIIARPAVSETGGWL